MAEGAGQGAGAGVAARTVHHTDSEAHSLVQGRGPAVDAQLEAAAVDVVRQVSNPVREPDMSHQSRLQNSRTVAAPARVGHHPAGLAVPAVCITVQIPTQSGSEQNIHTAQV